MNRRYRYLPDERELRKARQQIMINNLFFKIVNDLGDAIVDSSVEFIFKTYGKYPHFNAIRLARKKLKAIGDTLGVDDI